MRRIPGGGWLALLGGGEFSFGETEEADAAWLEKTPPGVVGFVPAASGSEEYPQHFAEYLLEAFEREVETLPLYRPRDARRGRNAERVAACAAVYLGGGVSDHLIDTLAGSPALAALEASLSGGGVVVAIAAAAQALGTATRGIAGGRTIPGLGWLPGGAIEANFDPDHDRRLRSLLQSGGVEWALGIPAEGALLLGPDGAFETVGSVFLLSSPDGELEELESE